MDELYRGWAGGRGSTRQAQTVVSSSLTPQTAPLVPITGPIGPVADRRGFTGSEKDRQ